MEQAQKPNRNSDDWSPPGEAHGKTSRRSRLASRWPRRWKLATLAIAVVVIAAAATLAAIWISSARQPSLPPKVASQLSFTPFVLDPSSKLTASDYKYDTSAQTLSFVLELASGQKLTVSQQPSPASFTDVPQTYDKLLTSLGKYATVSTASGTASLARPPGGGEVAVLNSHGVLVFIRSNKADLSKSDWRNILQQLSIKS